VVLCCFSMVNGTCPHLLKLTQQSQGKQAYAALLILATLVTDEALASVFSFHATCVLLATTGSFMYRDIWPLSTFTLQPKDNGGKILWGIIIMSSFAGIIIPLLEPYPYVPATPEVCAEHWERYAMLTAEAGRN
jgi:hypothetical protein